MTLPQASTLCKNSSHTVYGHRKFRVDVEINIELCFVASFSGMLEIMVT